MNLYKNTFFPIKGKFKYFPISFTDEIELNNLDALDIEVMLDIYTGLGTRSFDHSINNYKLFKNIITDFLIEYDDRIEKFFKSVEELFPQNSFKDTIPEIKNELKIILENLIN